jgi:hypothetical protein
VNDRDDIDARLERLARATENVAPRADFAARVARALEREEPGGVLLELGKPARRILPALALAAAVSLVWAVETDRSLDDELSFYDDEAVELEW